MKRFLCPHLPRKGEPVELSKDESLHATRVLRLQTGDEVEVMNGHGGACVATLRSEGKRVYLDFVRKTELPDDTGEVTNITLEASIVKGDAMEWLIEKAVELGVRSVLPVLAERTVVKVEGKKKGPDDFRDRWQRIADQSLKQCGRLQRLEVAAPVALNELVLTHKASPEVPRLWFDEAFDGGPSLPEWLATQPPIQGARLLIGPEGGWSPVERDLLFAEAEAAPGTLLRLGLGPLILRAETAGVFSSSLLSAFLRTRDSLTTSRHKREITGND